jgi:four helix bundle protein
MAKIIHLALTRNIRMSDTPARKEFDLGERTAKFAEEIIRLGKKIPDVTANRPVIRQLVASGTSIGANYSEANDAPTDRDFCWKMAICRKEASETKYWLRMVATAEPALKPEARELWREARQLHLIFAKIVRTMQRRLGDSEGSRSKA